jgi:SAM-dependent methyltransferase
MSDPMTVFDRRGLRKRRDRVADGFADYDFLVREAADRLTERLDDMARSFPVALDLGCHTGAVGDALAARGHLGAARADGKGGIDILVQSDLSPRMAARAAGRGRPALAADEEWLPFAPAGFDLILSCLSLHWVNDLPGTLAQIRRALKPDGLFLAAMPGLGTLAELRRALMEAELEIEGGAGPRVSPFADIRDLAGLMGRAGFVQPVVDGDSLVVRYAEPLRLFADLRGMGETNLVVERRRSFSRRATLFSALDRYRRDHADADGRLPATIELLTMTAWAPPEESGG